MKFQKIILVLFCSFFTLQVFSNKDQFERYSIKQGLSSNTINCITQDKNGYIWIGTNNGLNRFDGHQFLIYRNDPDDKNSLSDNFITCLLEENNYLWIGTKNGGLNKLNLTTNEFTNYNNFLKSDTVNISVNTVFDIKLDSENNLWLVLDGYFNKFNPKTEKFTNIFPENLYHHWGPKKLCFWDDEHFYIASWRSGLIFYNYKTNNIEKIYSEELNNFPDNTINYLYKTDNNTLIVCTWNKGVFEFDPTKNLLKKINLDKNDIPLKINEIIQDKNDNYWYATETNGLFFYSSKTKNFTNIQSQINNYNTIPNNRIRCLFFDYNENLWVGTLNGIAQYNSKKNKVQYYSSSIKDEKGLKNNLISKIIEDNENNIYIGTWGGGLYSFDIEKGEFNQLFKHNEDLNYVTDLLIDFNNTLWISAKGGQIFSYQANNKQLQKQLIQLDNKQNYQLFLDNDYNLWLNHELGETKVFQINKNQLIPKNNLQQIIDSHKILTNTKKNKILQIKGNYWFATSTAGIAFLNPNQNYILTFNTKSKEKLSSWRIENMLYDHNGSIWAISPENNINKININTYTVKQYNAIANCMHLTSDGELWFGTKSGLKLYDAKKDTFITYDEKDGLADNEIFFIRSDKIGFLWLGTNKGLSRFSPITKEFLNLNESDGIKEYTFSNKKTLTTSKGILLSATENGLNVLFPEKVIMNKKQPNLSFTALYINNQLINPNTSINNHIPLKEAISNTKEIKLTQKDYIFTIYFSSLDFIAPEKNQYAYKLDGFNNEWIHTNQNFASFTNIPSGRYTLLVNGSNNDGVWSTEPISIDIYIKPPFWGSWTFIALAIISIIFLLISYYYYRINRINSINETLNNKVKEKTLELQIQKEELKKINHTKDKLFSLIAHDLKNPFNAITGFGNLLLEYFDKYTDEKKIELIKYMTLASENANELLDNLLQWSRASINKLQYTPELFDINTLINDAINIIRLSAKNKQINIKHQNNEEVLVVADRNMINTVLRNLITNGIKFTPNGGEIIINHYTENQKLHIEITDNGIGMSQDTIDKLFKFEDHFTTYGTDGEKGTGIGLILCKEFINKHHGEIFIDSVPEKGTKFTIVLPWLNK
jgi:signal transduction histidine kinase/ligand-binding sensor domain-containing protein